MAMMRLRREDPRVVGSFRLHRRLGAGGMGVVYLGSDRKGQRVALKVIRPDLAEDQEFRSRFAREVSAARRIRGGCTGSARLGGRTSGGGSTGWLTRSNSATNVLESRWERSDPATTS